MRLTSAGFTRLKKENRKIDLTNRICSERNSYPNVLLNGKHPPGSRTQARTDPFLEYNNGYSDTYLQYRVGKLPKDKINRYTDF
jgi:hypothetical protein